MTSLSPATASRLEKAAVDNGFDRALPRQGDWLGFASTHVPLRLWLTALNDGRLVVAFSQPSVSRALTDHGLEFVDRLPPDARGGRSLPDIPEMHRLVRRVFQLSKTLPDELLHAFEKATAALSRATEAERMVVQRVGQEMFRAGLIDYWEGRCALTGFDVTELLRASHIKPWAACTSDAERLDVFNGFLLTPSLDAAFDRGFITVSDSGEMIVADELTVEARRVLGIDGSLRVSRLDDGHRSYLRYHREFVFRSAAS